jgi:hypothetical protein
MAGLASYLSDAKKPVANFTPMNQPPQNFTPAVQPQIRSSIPQVQPDIIGGLRSLLGNILKPNMNPKYQPKTVEQRVKIDKVTMPFVGLLPSLLEKFYPAGRAQLDNFKLNPLPGMDLITKQPQPSIPIGSLISNVVYPDQEIVRLSKKLETGTPLLPDERKYAATQQMLQVGGLVEPIKGLKGTAKTNEAIIEKAGGWTKGLREQFDTALLTKDKATIQKLLPDVPKEYQTRFADNINQILGESEISLPKVVKKIVDKSEKTPEIKTPKPPPPSSDQAATDALNLIEKTLSKNVPKAGRVGILDYVRTPQDVFTKIGLGKEYEGLRAGVRKATMEVPIEMDRIGSWAKEMPTPGSNQKIFQYLDGQPIQLDPTELRIAGEIKTYLKDWADKLKLPDDKRIAHYITHIFDDNFINKEFDPELANLIRDRVPGSVYDPFLLKRLGTKGYKEDVIGALDAYAKRAIRKYNTDEYLKEIADKSKGMVGETFDYIQKKIANINMRPSNLDILIDNTLKDSTPIGHKMGARPTSVISRKVRQMLYRSTLGLNVQSALRNLTQATNTYAELGEKYTMLGYAKLAKEMATGNLGELKTNGVLLDNMVQDRTRGAVAKTWEKIDNVLFSLFEKVETVNRGSAYYGAKQKFLDAGLSEAEAIAKAVDLVEKTQFVFGRADTPLIADLGGDAIKPLTMFSSYMLKQGEFLGNKVMQKQYASLVRYFVSSWLIYSTIGKALGWNMQDIVPFLGQITGDSPYKPPIFTVVQGVQSIPGAFSQDINTRDQSLNNINKAITLAIPAGAQAKKTMSGIQTIQGGGWYDNRDRLRFPIGRSLEDKIKAVLFGQYSLGSAKLYYDAGLYPLSQKDTIIWKNAVNSGYDPYQAWARIQKINLGKYALSDISKVANDLSYSPNEKVAQIALLREKYQNTIRRIDEFTTMTQLPQPTPQPTTKPNITVKSTAQPTTPTVRRVVPSVAPVKRVSPVPPVPPKKLEVKRIVK